MYLYNEDYDTRGLSRGESKSYTVELGGEERAYNLNQNRESKVYTVAMDKRDYQYETQVKDYTTDVKDNTYYIKAGGKSPRDRLPDFLTNITCADPGSFVKGGPTLTSFLSFMRGGRILIPL